jgi:hypothetical protein
MFKHFKLSQVHKDQGLDYSIMVGSTESARLFLAHGAKQYLDAFLPNATQDTIDNALTLKPLWSPLKFRMALPKLGAKVRPDNKRNIIYIFK